MSLEELLKTYANDTSALAKLEIYKTQIELELLDFNSKETMIKLVSSLLQSNTEYLDIHNKIITLKSSIGILDKQISVINNLISVGVFKQVEQIDRFVGAIL